MTAPEQQLLITEDQIITPAVEVLKQALPKSESSSREIPKSIKQSLDEMFPEQEHEEKAIQRAKNTLGALANEFSAEQIRDVVAEIQYLAESWLDDFEKEIFKGKTLKELLHDKGGL